MDARRSVGSCAVTSTVIGSGYRQELGLLRNGPTPACFSEQGGSHRRGGCLMAPQMAGESPMTYETKKQLQERFLADFLRRLREAPAGTRVYMRVGDAFKVDVVRSPMLSALTNCGPLAGQRPPAIITTIRGKTQAGDRAHMLLLVGSAPLSTGRRNRSQEPAEFSVSSYWMRRRRACRMRCGRSAAFPSNIAAIACRLPSAIAMPTRRRNRRSATRPAAPITA